MLKRQPDEQWHTITWRMGQDGPLSKQFIALWVNRSRDEAPGPAGWLIGERPVPGHPGEHKFYWSNLAADTPLARLAELAHRRPSIERRYQDGKDLTGLGAYPARLWHSFHRYLVIEFLTLSWLLLQQPPPDKVELVLEPLVGETPDQPVFPLRPRTLSQCRAGSGADLPVSLYGVGGLVGADRSN